MTRFAVMFGIMLFLLLGSFYWVTGRALSLYRVDIKKKAIRILRIILALLLGGLCAVWRTGLVVMLYLAIVIILTDAAAYLIRHVVKNRETAVYKQAARIYRTGVLQLFLVCLICGYGCYNMGHPVKTEYTLTSDKLSRNYDMVLLTDTHYGTIQKPQVLQKTIGEINGLKPDFVILGGDIVEEGTSKNAMKEAFQVLGNLRSTYGTYYVYGNHDRQNYTNAPAYTEEELAGEIEKNGIAILKDAYRAINEEVTLAGREDAGQGDSGRLSSETLLEGADRDHYIIMADHQPAGSEENAAQGVDLQLSGHTHAGQIFPVGSFLELSGGLTYGQYREGSCHIIVSSGFAGWGFPLRTQKRSEYVVIHLKKA